MKWSFHNLLHQVYKLLNFYDPGVKILLSPACFQMIIFFVQFSCAVINNLIDNHLAMPRRVVIWFINILDCGVIDVKCKIIMLYWHDMLSYVQYCMFVLDLHCSDQSVSLCYRPASLITCHIIYILVLCLNFVFILILPLK